MKCVRVTFYVTKYFGRNKFAIIAAGAAAAAFSVIFNNAKSILRRFCDSKDGCPYFFFAMVADGISRGLDRFLLSTN
jgi:hypothetical protein